MINNDFKLRPVSDEEMDEMVQGYGPVSFRDRKGPGTDMYIDRKDKKASKREWRKHNRRSLKPLRKPFALKCLKCNANFVIDGCSNCGHDEFWYLETTADSDPFISCETCRAAFLSRWVCSKCGCDNPVPDTLYLVAKKKKKFLGLF